MKYCSSVFRTITMFVMVLVATTFVAGSVSAQTTYTTLYYGNLTLAAPGGGTTFFGTWNAQACDLVVTYRINLTGVTPKPDWSTSWTSVGVRDAVGSRGWMSSGAPGAYYPNPNSLNIVDKHNLGGAPTRYDESTYDATGPNTLVTPPIGNPWSNYGVWFDRDGVDPWQATYWGSVNGGTYNTGGQYTIVARYHAVNSSATLGTMFNTTNGIQTGFYNGGWKNSQPENYPLGKSFTGDLTQLAVFASLWAPDVSYGTVALSDITASGCFNLNEGMATGGGWFIPESDKATGLVVLGSKATFGFVAKNKDGNSTGQLEFQYHGDNLNLKSTSYDWVTMANNQVMFEGLGTINGAGSYKFRVRAVDGDRIGAGVPDRFEIRIWTGGGSFDAPTYRAEGNLGGGQIVVRK